MSKKILILICIFIIVMALVAIVTTGININKNQKKENKTEKQSVYKNETGAIEQGKIELKDIDGKETNYIFEYNGKKFSAIYTKDNWRIVDSYKIKNKDDMTKICKSLIDIHPIHGKDMVSYRTVEDLVYEWEQHNVAYTLLPEDNKWKQNAKDVDLNPEDQGRNMIEFYEDRTGKKLNF